MAVVTKTLSPQTTGDDQATPGIGVFQRTFLPGPHSVGKGGPSTTPDPLPRNCGDSSAPPAAARPRTTELRRRAACGRMTFPSNVPPTPETYAERSGVVGQGQLLASETAVR